MFVLVLFVSMGLESALAACSQNVINGSASPSLNYDSDNNARQHQHFELTVGNTSGESCVLSMVLFASPVTVTLSNGLNHLNYGVSNNGTVSNIIDQLPSSHGHVKSLTFAGNRSEQLRWDFVMEGSQVVSAGDYTDNRVEIRAYEHIDGNPNNFSVANLFLRDSVSINARTTIAQKCSSLGAPAVQTANNIRYSGGANGNIDLSGAFDQQTSSLKDSTLVLNYANMACNYAANLSIQSQNGGLIQEGGSMTVKGFLNRVDYHAMATFCGQSVSFQTSGSRVSDTIQCNAGLNVSDLLLTIKTASSHGTPFLAGKYQDVLTIKIGSPI